MARSKVHKAFSDYLDSLQLQPIEKAFREALILVWRRQRGSVSHRLNALKIKKQELERKIRETTASYGLETDEIIKQSLKAVLKDYDVQLKKLETDILSVGAVEMESESFVRFAMDYVANIKNKGGLYLMKR